MLVVYILHLHLQVAQAIDKGILSHVGFVGQGRVEVTFGFPDFLIQWGCP